MPPDLQIMGSVRSALTPTNTSGSMPRLQHHEILRAHVLRSLPNGTTLLSIKGRQVPVSTQVRLQAGQSITLQVKSLSPTTNFQLVSEPAVTAKAGHLPVLLNALAENTWKVTMEAILQSHSGQQIMKNLLTLIQETTQGIFRNPGPDLLALLISKAGFRLEGKLKKAVLGATRNQAQLDSLLQNDLKALLLKAIGQGARPQGQLKQLLYVIENFQLLNQEGLQKGGRIFLPIPMQFADGHFTIGQLLIAHGQSEQQASAKQSQVEPVFTARLQLNLSRLGTIRTEVKLCAKQVSVNFIVSTTASKNVINGQLGALGQTLAVKGFTFKAVGCTVAESAQDMETLISELMPTETNILCLTA